MPTFRADLHIHSCLSPCGDLSASPRAIAAAAKKAGMDMVALTDHNTALNTPAFASACRNEGLSALFGLEITTREDIHALVLFPTASQAVRAGEEAYARLESGPFKPESFGDQIWVNDEEEIEGVLEKLLIIGATDLSLDEAGPWARDQGGILIPAHINRPAFGVLGQLGFLPEGPFEAVECTEAIPSSRTGPWAVTASSDAHRPEDVGRRYFEFDSQVPDFDHLLQALAENRVRPCYKS